MIFVYPALMSENVDRRYFPGVVKTLELYYLQHIAEAAASGVLNFYVVQDSKGGYSEVRLESKSLEGEYEPMSLILEAGDVKLGDDSLEKKFLSKIVADIERAKSELARLEQQYAANEDVKTRIIRDNKGNEPTGRSTTDKQTGNTGYEDKNSNMFTNWRHALAEGERLEKEIDKMKKILDNLYKQRSSAEEKLYEAEKEAEDSAKGSSTKRYETTGGASVKLDTTTMMDLRPTSISIDVSIRVIKTNAIGRRSPSNQYEPKRQIPISVKLVPMVVKNFDDIYEVLIDDMYTNKFSALYKSAARGFMGKVQNWFGGTVRKFVNAFIPSEEVSVWRDILMSKKGFADASSFRNADRGPKYQKYAAAIVIMSADDIRHQEQNFFDKPQKMMKLFKMGWNSFAVLNDADQTLIFCSYYENGQCAKIPYTYLFHSLKALDIFKEMEQLGGFTRRVIGNFGRTNLKKLSESINVRNEVDRKITNSYNQYLNVAENKQVELTEDKAIGAGMGLSGGGIAGFGAGVAVSSKLYKKKLNDATQEYKNAKTPQDKKAAQTKIVAINRKMRNIGLATGAVGAVVGAAAGHNIG